MPSTPSDPTPGADPYRSYAALRRGCPVQAVPSGSGGFPGYLVTGHAEARQALRLGGQDLDADRPVLVSLGAANRDPLAFADPDRLDLDRDARAHLAFGHGIHRRLGAPLARAELAVAVSTLLRRHPGLALAVPAEQLRWRETRLVRGLVALPVRL